jgi:hypothetical protein
MFNFFKKKTEDELLRDGIKKTIRNINKYKGGCGEVCINFTKELAENELFKSIGYAEEAKLSISKTEGMYAALMLLSALKNEQVTDTEDGFLMSIAEHSFVYSSCVASDEELQKLMLTSGAEVFTQRDELLKKNKDAWIRWLEADASLLKKATTPNWM